MIAASASTSRIPRGRSVVVAVALGCAGPGVVPGDTDVPDSDAAADSPAEDDTDVALPETGDTGWEPTPACSAPDATEPNEDPPAPTHLTRGGQRFVRNGLNIDGGVADDDRFSVAVPPGCRVDADVSFPTSIGDLLVLIEDGSALGIRGMTVPEGYHAVWGNTSPTHAVNASVDIGWWDVGVCVPYDLDISLTCPPACTPVDPTEPNDLPDDATPVVLDADGRFEALGVGLAGPLRDRDVWNLELPGGCYFTVAMDFDGAVADVDLDISVPNFSLWGDAVRTTDREELTWFNAGGYDMTIPIYVSTQGPACTTYDLSVERVCSGLGPGVDPAVCAVDAYEPNDDLATATESGIDTDGDVFVATGVGMDHRTGIGDDWYHAVLPAGCEFEARTAFNVRQGDINVEFWDDAGWRDSASAMGSPTASLSTHSLFATTPTNLWFRVYAPGPVCMSYDIALSLDCP